MYRPKLLTLKNFTSHSDTKYEFRQGSPVLLVGDNQDDSSQKGNGSGKSALIEAISYLITGSTIRKVQDRELIMDGEDLSLISLELENSRNGETFYIERTLSQKSSSTCYIEINGTEEKKASINDYNSFILERIGLSKEDFWNFFLVTKERYTPFFSSTDSSKKLIINRFSKADLIDTIDVKSELLKLEGDRKLKELQLSKLDGSLESLQTTPEGEESLEELKDSVLKLENSRKVLLENYNTILSDKNSIVTKKSTIESEISKQEELRLGLQKTLESKSNELSLNFQRESKELEVKLASEKATEDNLLEQEIVEYRTILTSKKNELEGTKSLIKENEIVINNVELKLSGAITCPKCTEKFLLDSEFSIPELESFYRELQDSNTKLLVSKKSIEEDIELLDSTINKTKQSQLELISKYSNLSIERINPLQLTLREGTEKLTQEFRDSTSSIKLRIEELTKEKELILKLEEETNFSLSSTKVEGEEVGRKLTLLKDRIKSKEENSLQKIIEEKKLERESLLTEMSLLDKSIDTYNVWSLRLKRFKSYLSNLSLSSIENLTNEFLDSLNSNLRIELEGYKELSDRKIKEEIVCRIVRDGYLVHSYGRFSAGERGRVDVCCILALQQLVNLNSPTGGLDLLVCDEILESIDSLGIESLLISLKSLNKNIILVSQNEIQSLQSNTVVVRKKNRISRIE